MPAPQSTVHGDSRRLTGYLLRFEDPLHDGDVVTRDSAIRARHVLPIVPEEDPSSTIGRTQVLIRDEVGVWIEAFVDEDYPAGTARLLPRYEALDFEHGRSGDRRIQALRLLRAELTRETVDEELARAAQPEDEQLT